MSNRPPGPGSTCLAIMSPNDLQLRDTAGNSTNSGTDNVRRACYSNPHRHTILCRRPERRPGC